MIDYIKIHYRDKIELEAYISDENNFPELEQKLEIHTSEILYPKRVKLDNMDIRVSNKEGLIKNSIHKLCNILEKEGDQNHNDFTYSRLCTTIDYLLKKIPVIYKGKITQLEFGLNVETDREADLIIKENIIMHDYKTHNHNNKYRGKGELKQFDYCNYYIKIYDKAKQYGLYKNNLRFEIKYITAKDFRDLEITYLTDLKDKMKLTKLFSILIEKFDGLMIIDPINKQTISDMDIQKLNKYMNPHFWEVKTKDQSRQTKKRHRDEFNKILKRNNLLTTKNKIRELLTKKFKNLLNN